MFAYLVRRVFSGVVMLIVMSLVTMVLFFSSAVDPARVMCGKNCSPALIEQTRKALGYDKPAYQQWGDFMVGVVKGREFPADEELRKSAPQLVVECPAPCLGYSTISQRTVTSAILVALPVSASLAFVAFIMWIVVGVGLGILAALHKGRLLDRTLVGSSLLFYAFPTFAIGVTISIIAIRRFGYAPSYVAIADGGLLKWFLSLLLPGLTLALVYIAGYVRLTRAFVLESMSEDYLRTARAKGLPPGKVLFKHTMRAALTPLVTIAGLDLGGLLGGAIITESVFNYNGLGKLAVLSNVQYDLPILVGIVLIAAAFIITANIIVDVLYAVIDPRVKYA